MYSMVSAHPVLHDDMSCHINPTDILFDSSDISDDVSTVKYTI
jgi:hypothetical protein